MQRLIEHDTVYSVVRCHQYNFNFVQQNQQVSIRATFCVAACETVAKSANTTPNSDRLMKVESPETERLKSNDRRHKLTSAFQVTFLLVHPFRHTTPRCACKHIATAQGVVLVQHSTGSEHKRCNSRNRQSEHFVP